MEDSAITLRSALEQTRPSCSSAGFPAELRERVSLWIVKRSAEGVAGEALAKQLGIAASTVRRWAAAVESPRAEGTGGFLPVTVQEVSSSHRELGGLVLHTPAGYRISGLFVEELIVVLRGLE